MTTNSNYESLKDFYSHHIHSDFHSDQAINSAEPTPDKDRPLPRWIEEALMDDDEWMDAKIQQMVEEQLE